MPKPNATSQFDPFGMLLTGRIWEVGSGYRYGFNGYENTDEILGDNIAVDFGARVYDARLGRFFSIDPRSGEYPWQSVYAYYSNCPILVVDVEGMGGTGDDPPTGNKAGAPVRTDYQNTSNYFAPTNWVENDLINSNLVYYHKSDPNQRVVIYWDPNAAINGVHKDPVTGEIVGNGAYRAVREIRRSELITTVTPAIYSDEIIIPGTVNRIQTSRRRLGRDIYMAGNFSIIPASDLGFIADIRFLGDVTGVNDVNGTTKVGVGIVLNLEIPDARTTAPYPTFINNVQNLLPYSLNLIPNSTFVLQCHLQVRHRVIIGPILQVILLIMHMRLFQIP